MQQVVKRQKQAAILPATTPFTTRSEWSNYPPPLIRAVEQPPEEAKEVTVDAGTQVCNGETKAGIPGSERVSPERANRG